MNVSSSSGVSLLASNLFNKLDTKQKGYVDKSDMQSAFNSLSSVTSSSNDVSEVFTQLDADSDGKLTQTELSDGLQTLADALQSQLQQSRLQGAGGMQGPPPPPPPEGDDEGFTQDELSTMASDSSTDSKRASLMSKLAANFDAADTDGNGKVTRSEAMAYDQSTKTDSATASTSSASSTDSTSSTSDALNLKAMVQLMQLLQAYGVSSDSSKTTSGVSVAA